MMAFAVDKEERPAVKMFREAAEKVSAVVVPVATRFQALAYAVDLCARKEACQLLMAGCESPLSPAADRLCGNKQQKVMAAPGLDGSSRAALAGLCEDNGIVLTGRPLREHLAGIDIGVTWADFGIAETGTLVIASDSEELRLATMISEIHVAVLPVSRIRDSAEDLAAELRVRMASAPNYLAFITGASRTADIERVLAIGVHGPLELHIVLLGDA
jgi:L-lactate dehydrogenase complex protein LldG